MDYRTILNAVNGLCAGEVDWTYAVSERGTLYVTLRRGGFRYTFCFGASSPRALDGALCPEAVCWLDVGAPGWRAALPGFVRNRIVDFRRFCLRVTTQKLSLNRCAPAV